MGQGNKQRKNLNVNKKKPESLTDDQIQQKINANLGKTPKKNGNNNNNKKKESTLSKIKKRVKSGMDKVGLTNTKAEPLGNLSKLAGQLADKSKGTYASVGGITSPGGPDKVYMAELSGESAKLVEELKKLDRKPG